MNKNFKKVILGMFMAALVLFVSGVAAKAASYPVKSLKEDKYVTHPGTGYVDYKIKVDATGYIKVNLKKDCTDWTEVCLYNSSKKTCLESGSLYDDKTSASFKWGVVKGTYYLRVYHWGDSCKAKVKYDFTKVTAKSNYVKGKAITLEKGKTVNIVQTRDKCYDRWYKIKLTKKQPIRYWFNEDDTWYHYVRVYDSKMNQITFIDDGDTRLSSSTLKKGTYYVRVSYDSGYSDLYQRRATWCSFKWK